MILTATEFGIRKDKSLSLRRSIGTVLATKLLLTVVVVSCRIEVNFDDGCWMIVICVCVCVCVCDENPADCHTR